MRTMPFAELLRLRLPCGPTAPRRAREALCAITALDGVRDDALLVASELATNAVLHSGCSAAEEFELWADEVQDGFRITVIDQGHSGDEPARREIDPTRPGGMGLAVVEQLSRSWGSERDGCLTVWAELAGKARKPTG